MSAQLAIATPRRIKASHRRRWKITAGHFVYQHTDALGSPVAVTDASKAVTERTQYTPYGAPLNHPVEGIGYTGHVMDQGTGLVYAQQRYFDPQLGRFLSVDPMASDTSTAWNFNRYNYANNNPYKFTDPDGRKAKDNGPNSPKVDDDSLTRKQKAENREKIKQIKSTLKSIGNAIKKTGDAKALSNYTGLTVNIVGSAPQNVVDEAVSRGMKASDIMGFEQKPGDGIVTLLPAIGLLADPKSFTPPYHGMEMGAGSSRNLFKGASHEVGHEFKELWSTDPVTREQNANQFVNKVLQFYEE